MSSKTKKILCWVCIGILTLQFVIAGLTKFTGGWTAMFKQWGYPATLMYVTGGLELIAVVGLYFLYTRKWAAMLLICIMAGAFYTHLAQNEPMQIVHDGIILLISLAVILLAPKSAAKLKA